MAAEGILLSVSKRVHWFSQQFQGSALAVCVCKGLKTFDGLCEVSFEPYGRDDVSGSRDERSFAIPGK